MTQATVSRFDSLCPNMYDSPYFATYFVHVRWTAIKTIENCEIVIMEKHEVSEMKK